MGSVGRVIKTPEDAYIVGLWCADGYHRTSSVGLSNTDPALIERFGKYLEGQLPQERLRLRVYVPSGAVVDVRLVSRYNKISLRKVKKARHASYHIYVNCRALLRRFIEWKQGAAVISKVFIMPYLAGRFDGDGSVNSNLKKDFRIAYGSREEAEADKTLLEQVRPYRASIYQYKMARTYCLYISQKDAPLMADDLALYSSKLQKMVAHTL